MAERIARGHIFSKIEAEVDGLFRIELRQREGNGTALVALLHLVPEAPGVFEALRLLIEQMASAPQLKPARKRRSAPRLRVVRATDGAK